MTISTYLPHSIFQIVSGILITYSPRPAIVKDLLLSQLDIYKYVCVRACKRDEERAISAGCLAQRVVHHRRG